MSLYGIPYMGSKTKIAPNILSRLPSGNRFVDLFGGGFAMSHCAMLMKKWQAVLYNEYDPLIPPLIKRALAGEFNYNRFKPEFITSEEFLKKKDKDGYIKTVWSFGNNGSNYLFSKEIEPYKKEAHDFVVFGKPTKHFKVIEKHVKSKDISQRRLQFCGACKKLKKRFDLEQLERLQQLERLEQLEIRQGSYSDYEYQKGDIVYCDPPYEGTAGYTYGFDHKKFYEWVKSRKYQVWFSSYQGIKGFKMVWAKQLRSSYGSGNKSINYECLYTNK